MTTKTLRVKNYDELRDKLPTSGLFEMSDCEVEIWCSLDSDTVEIARMTNLIESMVHVVDVRVGSEVESMNEEIYKIILSEPPQKSIRERYFRER